MPDVELKQKPQAVDHIGINAILLGPPGVYIKFYDIGLRKT